MDREQGQPPPIATATVARLYLEQGKLQQAEALFLALLEQSPEDPLLLSGLARVERCKQARQGGIADDRVAVEVRRGELRCNWKISAEDRRRAALVLGQEGHLALRLAPFPTDASSAAPRTIAIQDLEGQLSSPLPGAEVLMLAAAIGLVGEGERFVSIAHCRPVRVRPIEPSKE